LKVAMICTSMSRQAGGIFYATKSLSQELRLAGTDVNVISAKDKYSDADRGAWGETPVKAHAVRGPASFAWQPDLIATLRSAKLDILHQHGLWTFPSIATLLSSGETSPRIISPHGMLDPWALRNSSWKKRVARTLFEDANLRGAACLHALCEAERDAIRSLGIKAPVAVVPNGVDLTIADGAPSAPPWASAVPKGARVLLYLGRLHPKKGLVALIEGFAEASRREHDWHLVIAGWDQGGHEKVLKALACALGIAALVHFVGPQFNEHQRATFAAADAFVLPSLSEGLPMSVLEAWAFRLPVIMTRECNLPTGFSEGAAFEVTSSQASIARALETVFTMPVKRLASIGEAGRCLVERQFSWPHIAGAIAEIYDWAIGGGQPPGHVVMDVA
jgi:glycosyltransferase involved in cell wall biosynthesis